MTVRPNEITAAIFQRWRADPVDFAVHMQSVLSVERWTPYAYLAKMMRHIARRIMEGGARVIVSMPPRHGKSLSLSYWLNLWYLSLFPERKILLSSYATSLPTEFTRKVRDSLLEVGESLFGIELPKANEGEIETNYGGGMKAAGVGKGITGKGFDLGIVDDPVADWQEAMSPTQLQKKIDWFNSTFYTRKSEHASVVVIMTRWANRDLAGYLEHESSEDWEVISLPAIAVNEDDWMGRRPGEALCPERWPVESLEAFREAIGSPKIWAGLYQQSPKVDSGGVFDVGRFKRWTRLPVPESVIISWDASFGSKSKTSSYVVAQVWLKAAGDYYLVWQERGRWELPRMMAVAVELQAEYGTLIRRTLIENKAFGGAIEQQLRGVLQRIEMVEPAEYGSKQARAEASSVAVDAGRVYIPDESMGYEWVAEFVEELDAFPTGANDDQVDAASQAINWFEMKSDRGVWAPYLHRRKKVAA